MEKDTKPRLLKAPFASIDFDLSPDGRQALFASNKEVILWDVDKEVEIVRFTMPQQTERVVFSRDGRRALAGTTGFEFRNGKPEFIPSFLWLFDLEQKKQLQQFEGHIGHCDVLRFSPDGKLAVSVDAGRTLRVWKLPQQ